MSYVARQHGLGGIGTVINAAAAVVEDPCLSQVADLVLKLHDPTAAALGDAAPAVGIGLCKVVKPLSAYVWARQNPWAVPLGLAAAVGAVFLTGMAFGGKR